MAMETLRDSCIRAFLDLVAERSFERLSVGEVAERAGVPLSQMRLAYASRDDLLDDHARAIDRQVLSEGGPADWGDEPAQERRFEILMRRLDALEPHRAAVASLLASARRNPRLAAGLLKTAVRSQRWMLAAAGLDATGLRGDVRAHGLAILFGRVVNTWLKDEDPGLSRTMAFLDEELRSGAKLLGMMDDLVFLAVPWRTRRRADRAPDAQPPGDAEVMAPPAA
ncbi:MAG: TetR family transcriptional regulator [Rhizobiales bacterium 32-66-8]|nr:MAG: TetR family transcriptional regulator [Rhizobiales bacterium 32-66-8]